MRAVHYYRRAAQDRSGVTAALGIWHEVALSAGIDSVVLHAAATSPQTKYQRQQSIRHLGIGRTTAFPMLGKHLREGDILILHEGWVTSNLVAAWTARRTKTPYIVMPHGVYEPEIIEALKWAPRLRLRLERFMLRRAAAVHFFYTSEKKLIREWGHIPSFVLPTPFEGGGPAWNGSGDYLAWFGRYSLEHKGLDLILKGMALIPAAGRPRLELRGYDDQGGLEKVAKLVAELGLQKSVEVGPRVDGNEKLDFIARSRAYVHPSRWECHSIALLEALSLGAPCMVSSSIHAATLLRLDNAAMLIDPTPEAWADALIASGDKSVAAYARVSNAFVQAHFSPAAITADYRRRMFAMFDRGSAEAQQRRAKVPTPISVTDHLADHESGSRGD